ncbi:hypothetical protein Zmor_022577 [Zophobas morio]|uniref:CRAL-TRIO domain-containing protein n=1 Tax=Zophobas morio TaxID=2755281 RepID=A0AA38HXU1_9CUCU|nr:hypothetical protein Zmor_022577 [Zophobas morio]
MSQVSQDTKKKIYETFGRNEEMVEDDVNIIKTWMQTQPHLPEILDDTRIKNFLNLNKFSLEKTKQKIDMYYTIRTLVPDIFQKGKLKLENIQKVFDDWYVFYFPMLVNDVHRVYYMKAKRPNIVEPVSITAVLFALYEIRLHEDFMVDDIVVVDMGNHTFRDVQQMTPTYMSNCHAIYKKVYSLRLKKIVFLNCPSYISILVALLKNVLTPKLFERVEFDPDDAGIKKVLSKGLLPKEYGGEGLSLDNLNDIMYKKLGEYQTRFDQLDELRVDESLRPEKLNNDEILGYYGSFKKINID